MKVDHRFIEARQFIKVGQRRLSSVSPVFDYSQSQR